MSHSHEDRLIENYFSQSTFNKLVMYPTLAPQLVPTALHDGLGIRTTSIETENSNVSKGMFANFTSYMCSSLSKMEAVKCTHSATTSLMQAMTKPHPLSRRSPWSPSLLMATHRPPVRSVMDWIFVILVRLRV